MTELSCDDLQDLLGDLVADELTPEVIIVVERHLCDCPGCGGRLALYRATIILTRALPRHADPLPEAFAARMRKLLLTDGGE